MIDQIFTENFKGLEFGIKLKEKNIIFGSNSSGKSAAAQVLQICVNGFVHSNQTAYKKPADIIQAFGSDNKVHTGIKINDKTFERIFSQGKKQASQNFKINGIKGNKSYFIQILSEAGFPRIFDLVSFMALSDQEKINEIFRLFPPDEDIHVLESEIESLKNEKNHILGEKRTAEEIIKSLEKSKADLDLPSGSLSEIQDQIQELTEIVRKKQADLAEIEAREKIEAEQAAAKKAAETKPEASPEPEKAPSKPMEGRPGKKPEKTPAEEEDFLDKQRREAEESLKKQNEARGIGKKADPVESINKIIEAIDSAGCSVCFARTVALSERKKLC